MEIRSSSCFFLPLIYVNAIHQSDKRLASENDFWILCVGFFLHHLRFIFLMSSFEWYQLQIHYKTLQSTFDTIYPQNIHYKLHIFMFETHFKLFLEIEKEIKIFWNCCFVFLSSVIESINEKMPILTR